MKLSELSDFDQAGYHAGCAFGHTVKAVIALARCRWFRVAVAFGVFAAMTSLFAGCRHAPAVAPSAPSAPVIASQEGKDTAILAEAVKIDAIAPAAKPHTDAQRAAIAAAPAADVKRILTEKDAIIAAYQGEVKKLNERIDDLKDAEQKKQVATLRWIGFGVLALVGLFIWLHQYQPAALSALVGIACLGLAQLISQPWFQTAVWICTGAAIVALCVIAYKKYQKDTLAKSIAADAERMKSALTTIVPAVDSALESLDAAAKTTVKSVLSRALDSDHKALIHEVRAKLKSA